MVQLYRKLNRYITGNRLHESDEYHQKIKLDEGKRALSLLHKNESEVPHTIKNEFLKDWGEPISILLKDYFPKILEPEDIPTQWDSSILINIDKGFQDNEKLNNKRSISLTSNIVKLFQRIIIIRLNNHLHFTKAQARAQRGKNTLTSLMALEFLIQQRMNQYQEIYVAFIDLEKAFGKVNAIFYLLWKKGIRGKL